MAVDLSTLRGKCDYDVEIAIRTLATAVNQLEGSQSVQATQQLSQSIAGVRAAVDTLAQRVEDLARRVQALEP